MKKMERKENANKGFSLVELIVVIAIMAVLIGILAPQFLKYVERSRQSTDKQNVDSIVSALEVYSVDETVATADQIGDGAVIKLTGTSAAVDTSNATLNADKALKAAGISTLELKSDNWNSADAAKKGTITLTVHITDGVVSVTADDATMLE